MSVKTFVIILGAVGALASNLSADSQRATEAAREITDRDFQVASLLHRIYEFSVLEEKVNEKIATEGATRSPLDGLPTENLKAAIDALEDLADVPALRLKLSRDVEKVRKSGLGPNHPTRRWLELLSRSLDKYSVATN